MKLSRFGLVTIVAATGCGSQLQQLRPGEEPGAGEVVLVGLSRFDPHVEPGKPAAIDVQGQMSNITLGFTDKPDSPVNIGSMSNGLDAAAMVPPARPFAIRAPRKTLYLRSVTIYGGYHFTGRVAMVPYPEAEKKLDWIHCLGSKRITPAEGDRYIYIGTLTCHHQGGVPVRVSVADEWDATQGTLKELVGDKPVARRLAEDVAGP